jgi:hypothetical protein
MTTDFKMSMIEDGRSMAEEYLIDLLQREVGEFSLGIIGAPFHMLRDRITGHAPSGVKIPQGALLHALGESGWRNIGRLMSRTYQSKKQIYISPRVALALAEGKITKTEIRDSLEGTPAPNVVKIR